MLGKKIRITQVKSIIKTKANQKATVKALGLGKPSYSVELICNPCVMGQVRVVSHLVKVEVIK